MSHPLEQQIARLRRQVRLLVWTHAVCWLVAATLLAVLTLGLIDYLCHFSLPFRKVFADPGIRVISSLLAAGVCGWFGYRYVLRGARARFADVALASRVEGRFPDLHDRLTSAMEFLREREHDPQAGSSELRRAVIAQATAAVEQVSLSQTVDYRPAVRAGVAAGLVVLLGAAAVLAHPQAAGTALARLVNPLGGPDWPQETHLQFQAEITRAATGKPLELIVVDGNELPLPKEVRLLIRYDGESKEQTLPMRPVDETMVHRFAAVTRPFTYWAEGGDDLTMRQRPIRLDVIEPPAVQTLSIELHPPAYTGWPPVKSEKHIRALEGTRVAFAGTANKPLRSATLCLSEAGKIVQQTPAAVDADGLGFRIIADGQLAADGQQPFVVAKSGQYWFRLEDAEGIVGDEAPHELRSVSDTPPTVTIDEPRQEAEYTVTAVVPLRITVKDDIALRGVTLKATKALRGSDPKTQPSREITILPAEEQPPPQPLGLATDKLGETRTLVHNLALHELFGNVPHGTQIVLVASASDFRPQSGQSAELRLDILEPDRLLARIADKQVALLQKLREILVIQHTARKELSGVEARFGQLQRLEKPDIDALERSKLSQDRVNDGLTNPASGVAAEIERLLAYLRDNRVGSSEASARMEAVLTVIRQLQKEQLPSIVNELRDAGKAAQAKLPSGGEQPKQVTDHLASAGKGQDEVIAALEGLLGKMTEWDNFHRFAREIADLRRGHDQIAAETAKLAPETLTKDFKDLTPQQQGELRKLGQRQRDLAREFDAIQQRMADMKKQLSGKDRDTAGVLGDALDHARTDRVGGELRDAAGNLDQNQLGQAGQRQQTASNSLREMLDILANRPEQNRSRLVEKLRQAEQEIKNLANRQKGLQKKMQGAAANPDPAAKRRELQKLTEEQRALRDEAEKLARKLRRLQAEEAAAQAESAASKMGQAGDQAEKGDADQAQQNAEQALADLDQAGKDLADARRQAELDLALEQLAKIKDDLEGLRNRQQSLSAETLRLDQLAAKQPWTDAQQESVRDLSRQEMQLRQDLLDLAEKLSAAAVFEAALKAAARELELAADQLKDLKTGQPTQNAQRNVLRRMEQLLEAIKPVAADNSKKSDSKGGGGGGGDQQQMPKDGVTNVAQLKLLRMMQLELNIRTKELDARASGRQGTDLTEIEQRERGLISQQQGEVARLTLNLSRPKERADDDAAEMLPDISDDLPPGGAKKKTAGQRGGDKKNDDDGKKLDTGEARTKNQGPAERAEPREEGDGEMPSPPARSPGSRDTPNSKDKERVP